jgi:hypothetical protein
MILFLQHSEVRNFLVVFDFDSVWWPRSLWNIEEVFCALTQANNHDVIIFIIDSKLIVSMLGKVRCLFLSSETHFRRGIFRVFHIVGRAESNNTPKSVRIGLA